MSRPMQLLKQAADRAGIVLDRKTVHTSSDHRREALIRFLNVDTVWDVGANAGQYARQLRAAGYTGPVESFEPVPGVVERLRQVAAGDPRWTVHALALSDEDGETDINVAASDPWSSLLPVDDRAADPWRLAIARVERVRTARLDSLDLAGSKAWLKLDVQGLELHVLRGAQETLGRVAAVECEISLEPFYEGQPTVRQLVDFLDDHGFQLVTVNNGWVREDSGRARWMDGIFARSTV